jgi:hypothetical protein
MSTKSKVITKVFTKDRTLSVFSGLRGQASVRERAPSMARAANS